MVTKELLTESYKMVKRTSGLDPRTPQGFRAILADSKAFGAYVSGLSEGLSTSDAGQFNKLCKTTRQALMENSMFQLNPYETLTVPILRNFYPRLIAKELVNVMPIDKPDVIKGFIRAYFKRAADSAYGNQFPAVNADISRGPGFSVSSALTIAYANFADEDVLGDITIGGTPLTSADAHIEKDFKIIAVNDGTNSIDVTIIPDVDANFSMSIPLTNGQTEVISGHMDYLTGHLYMSTTGCGATGYIQSVDAVAIASLEENMINPYIKFEIEKIRMTVIDRRISAEWSINIEQDVKALFDLQLQAELVNIIGEQIAIDIDREIINALLDANATNNGLTHVETFNLYPPSTFTWGRKLWYENVIPKLNKLSARVYNDCLMGAANTLACNPIDAAVFESLNTFEYSGNSVDGGDVGYKSATVQGGKWKILVSSLVPQGRVIVKYRSTDIARAAFVYAPYVPAVLTPYPIGENPSLTILSRYATKVIRYQALAELAIVDDVVTRDNYI
jgi:hypothetical protein